jgi:hypothetical protein
MIEKLHIYKKTAISNKLNDIDVMSLNKICEVTIEECPNHLPEYTFRTANPKDDKYRDMETYTRNVGIQCQNSNFIYIYIYLLCEYLILHLLKHVCFIRGELYDIMFNHVILL